MKKLGKVSPIAWIPTAYFAMGLPFVVVNMVAVLMFEGMGIDKATITFWTSLILLPWTIKPLWSPFLELYKTKKFYVVATQLLTGAAFGLTALSLSMPQFFVPAIIFLALVAFSGATHDIACDGVYMSELSSTEQAKYIGWQGAFYNIAKIVATGGLVWLAGWLIDRHLPSGITSATANAAQNFAANRSAWSIIMAILSVSMIALGVYHIFILPSSEKRLGKRNEANTRSGKEAAKELWSVLSEFFTKRHILIYILFIILYRLGEGFVVKIVPLFLKATRAAGGLELDNQQIGLFYGTFGSAAFVIGSLLAGYYISSRGLRKTLLSLVAIFNIPFAVYALMAWFQPTSSLIIAGGIVFEYFGYGFGFVGLTLFMMQQVAPGRHQMSHYAFASGIMNLGVMIPGMLSGWLCDLLGYSTFFIAVMVLTIPAFIMAWKVPFSHDDSEHLDKAETAALTDVEENV